ncbi:MAG: hypothetical protein AAFY36_17590, partial [Bacteroidota bacterium]
KIFNSNLFSINGSINFGGFTYTPTGDLSRFNYSTTFRGKLGPKPGTPVSVKAIDIAGFRSAQIVNSSPISRRSYGYLHLDGAENDRRAIMDYNSEKNGIFAQNSPRLPMAYGTPDVYLVSGVGVGGRIRVARNDVGIFRPPYNQTIGVDGTAAGLELTAGAFVHPGIDIEVAANQAQIRDWENRNFFSDILKFTPSSNLRESAFMMMEGEPNAQLGRSWHSAIGQFSPINTIIKDADLLNGVSTENHFIADNRTGLSDENPAVNHNNWTRTTRRPRAQMVSFLTNEEAVHAAVRKNLVGYNELSLGEGNEDDSSPRYMFEAFSTNRMHLDSDEEDTYEVNDYREPHHISQISITNTEGRRYVYGLAAYNTLKKEVTFNVSGRIPDPIDFDNTHQTSDLKNAGKYGLVNYTSATDASINNSRGTNQYYDEVVTPAYPYAHLLTEVLSSDYIDRTGDGPSQDDLGQYVTVNYSKSGEWGSSGSDGLLGWRVPVGFGKANYNPGNLSDPNDDMGSYTFGTKEVWYVHHMESKTHRVVFYTSPREDLRYISEVGIPKDYGSFPRYRKLDEIRVYTLSELENNGDDAVPLKTIHFDYHDYKESVSPGLPTSMKDTGPNGNTNRRHPKLTLKSVSITYEDNDRGNQNPYTFHYKVSHEGDHINFRNNMFDRWGNQRGKNNDFPGPRLFPYTSQNEDEYKKYCDLGNLVSIELPSGGSIEVEYEPDSYAYVQDRRAGRMFRLIGFEDDAGNFSTDSYGSPPLNKPNLNLIVEVDDLPMDNGEVDLESVKRLYFEDVEQLYFQARVGLTGSNENIEQVDGFIPFNIGNVQARIVNDGPQLIIPIRAVNANNEASSFGGMNPITFAGLEKVRLELPHLIYDMPEIGDDLTDILLSMLTVLEEVTPTIRGFHRQRLGMGFAKTIDPFASFVRLADPSFAKFGDGSRVRSVELTDNWLPDLNQQVSYTQVYTYETKDPLTGATISSGVAANEPQIGREESLLVNVEKSTQRIPFAPNTTYYVESPIGEAFYPGGQVGYSRVSMQQELDEEYQQSKPGSTVYEYFTARDFPVIATATDISEERRRPIPNLTPLISVSFCRACH